MPVIARQIDLVAAGLDASRAARDVLGAASNALTRLDDLPFEVHDCQRLLHRAIDALSLLEEATPEDTHAAIVSSSLASATAALSTVLSALQSTSASEELDRVTAQVARAMASLYPVSRGFERAMEPDDDEPVLLVPKRRALEIVPDDDDPALAAGRSGSQRRQAPRVELSVDIGYHSETNFFTGFSDDISEGGLFVATYDLLEVGTTLALSFVLPHGPLITVRGRVAWIREAIALDGDLRPGMGVVFDEVDEVSVAAIRRFMDARAPIFHD